MTWQNDLLWCLQAVDLPLKISQTAAILEVVHAATGIVKSPVAITGTAHPLTRATSSLVLQ